MTLPNFFIVGAMKSGTTSLYEYLCQHPEIFMSPVKEPFYFVWAGMDDRNKLYMLDKHHKKVTPQYWQAIRTREQYEHLFRKARNETAIGEASTWYLPASHVPEQIHHEVSDAKIIAVLRDPVARAYSAYTYQVSYDLEPSSTFRGALEDELSGRRDDWLYGWRYLYCGMYADQIERYLDVFGANNVLLLRFEELKRHPQIILERVFRFLDVKDDHDLEYIVPKNPTINPNKGWAKSAISILNHRNAFKDKLKRFIPFAARQKMKSRISEIVKRSGTKPPAISEADVDFLRPAFKGQISKLEAITGWDLNEWT